MKLILMASLVVASANAGAIHASDTAGIRAGGGIRAVDRQVQQVEQKNTVPTQKTRTNPPLQMASQRAQSPSVDSTAREHVGAYFDGMKGLDKGHTMAEFEDVGLGVAVGILPTEHTQTITLTPKTVIKVVTKERIVYRPISENPDALIKKLTFSNIVTLGKASTGGITYRTAILTGIDSGIELRDVKGTTGVAGHQGNAWQYTVTWDPNQGKFLDKAGRETASGFSIHGNGSRFVLNHKDGSSAILVINKKADTNGDRVFTGDNGRNLKIIKDSNALNLCFFYSNNLLGCIDYAMTYKLP